MSDTAFLADRSRIAAHVPLAEVREIGLGGETAHIGDLLQRVVRRPQQIPDALDTALAQPRGGGTAENLLEMPTEGDRAGVTAQPGEFRDIIRGQVIGFDAGDELVIVAQVQQLLELLDVGRSEPFIGGIEHFQRHFIITFDGHTQCLTGLTQVVFKPEPQRVMVRAGTLRQDHADLPQLIDTAEAAIPRDKTLHIANGGKLLREHQQ